MCGIVYKKSFVGQVVNRDIRKQYFAQRNRGMEGFGFIAINENGKAMLHRELYEHEIMHDLKSSKSSEIIFHHRWPTSTKNSIQTNHPIPLKNRSYKHNYYLIHNGIIYNDDVLHEEHHALGINYKTRVNDTQFNDSEALGHELVMAIEGIKPLDKFNARGSIAFILLQTDKHDKPLSLYFGRNWGSPLKMKYDKEVGLSLSSEGQGDDVVQDRLYNFDYGTRVLTYQHLTIPYTLPRDYQALDSFDRSYARYHQPLTTSGDDTDDEDGEFENLAELDDEELQDYYYEYALQRQALIDDLASAQRVNDWDEEVGIQEEIDEVDDTINLLEKEINRRQEIQLIENN